MNNPIARAVVYLGGTAELNVGPGFIDLAPGVYDLVVAASTSPNMGQISKMRDALTRIAEYPRERGQELSISTIRHIACQALAATTPAEQAPSEPLAVRQYRAVGEQHWRDVNGILSLGPGTHGGEFRTLYTHPAPHADEAEKWEMYFVKGWGETELPEVALVRTLGEVKTAILTLIFGEPVSECHPNADEARFYMDEIDKCTEWPWTIRFEIGGIEVDKVFVAPVPPAEVKA